MWPNARGLFPARLEEGPGSQRVSMQEILLTIKLKPSKLDNSLDVQQCQIKTSENIHHSGQLVATCEGTFFNSKAKLASYRHIKGLALGRN